MAVGQKVWAPVRCLQTCLDVSSFSKLLPSVMLDNFYSEPETVFSSLSTPITPSTLTILTSTIARRLTPQPIKLRADIELTCYTPAGIDAIKRALRTGEKQSTEAVPIKAKLVAPPLYVLSTNATDKVRQRYSWNTINFLIS